MGNQISELVKKAVKKFRETANNMKLDKSVINGLFIKGDQISRGEELVKKAEKKLNDWGIFGSKYHDAADLLYKAVDRFRFAKSWDRVGAVYVKLASCHLKLDQKHEAARSYDIAADYYKMTKNLKETISCLEKAAHILLDIGRLNATTRHYQEITKLYEHENNLELAIVYYQKTTDLFQSMDLTSSANQCRQKIAEYSAKVGKFQRSIAMFEEIATYSIRNNLLKYGVRGHLLNAGICQLFRGDVVAINNALERYQILDTTFSGTRECKLLMGLAAAIDKRDVAEFTSYLKEYDSTIKRNEWRTLVLLKVKEALKAKELESKGQLGWLFYIIPCSFVLFCTIKIRLFGTKNR
ncbi:hypothetical protein MTR67_053411 [Solanum verrucosum]|uniref:Alpha-soluble NSF attachment protein n=1 Tax=Solanum verrucosum TaxID=315347 RepID=A0AAF0VAT7_SOLVR|nr:hypothetical protein MTR67_053411 [Solanum verrucosum]